MNQIIAEANVVEIEESQTLISLQADDAIAELSASQLFLVGGGSGAIDLT
jgi:hypothetical protein